MVQEGLHPQRARGQGERAGYLMSLSRPVLTGASCTGGKRGEDLNHVAG